MKRGLAILTALGCLSALVLPCGASGRLIEWTGDDVTDGMDLAMQRQQGTNGADTATLQAFLLGEDVPTPETLPQPDETADLVADFTKGSSGDFYASDGWTNGSMFNCYWRKQNCVFENERMYLQINEDSGATGYGGAEYRTQEMYGYGDYEVCMKPISNTGVVSSFFTCTGPSDENPWDEIDIEFLGKDTTKVQFNYFTNGVGNHEYIYDLGFDASKEYHTYGFQWLPDGIQWTVDGEVVHTATADIPTTAGRLMMNVWNGTGVDSWLGAYDGTTPLTAEYVWATYTKAEE